MTHIPIIAHHTAAPTSRQVSRAETLATTLASEQPELTIRDAFRSLVPEHIGDAPTLHLDDLSTIVQLDRYYDVTFLEDRTHLRATDGDMVASCAEPNAAFEEESRCGFSLELRSNPIERPNSPVVGERPVAIHKRMGVGQCRSAHRRPAHLGPFSRTDAQP